MISGAQVLCDGSHCRNVVFVGHRSDREVEAALYRQNWIVKRGHHYCCESCALTQPAAAQGSE